MLQNTTLIVNSLLKKLGQVSSTEMEITLAQRQTVQPEEARSTTLEKTKEFREWVLQLPKGSPSLPDEAFSRDNIYE